MLFTEEEYNLLMQAIEEQEQEEEIEKAISRLESGDVDFALRILTAPYDALFEWFGWGDDDVIRHASALARQNKDGDWSTYDPDYPNDTETSGVVVKGKRYATRYNGVIGNYWNSPWDLWG